MYDNLNLNSMNKNLDFGNNFNDMMKDFPQLPKVEETKLELPKIDEIKTQPIDKNKGL